MQKESDLETDRGRGTDTVSYRSFGLLTRHYCSSTSIGKGCLRETKTRIFPRSVLNISPAFPQFLPNFFRLFQPKCTTFWHFCPAGRWSRILARTPMFMFEVQDGRCTGYLGIILIGIL